MTNQIYTLKYLNFNGVLPFNCNRILEGLFPINGCYILNFQIRKLDKIPIGNICKKLMVVMDLIIFIVFEVQANNNFISSSLFSSSLPIIHFSHSSQLDNIVPGPLYNCLDFKLKFCKQKYGSASTDFAHCYINGFVKCLSKHHEHSTPD